MGKVNMSEDYIRWIYDELLSLPDFSPNRAYCKLVEKMMSLDFVFIVSQDKNRYEDGLYLRSVFCEEKGLDYWEFRNSVYGPCSVLEMIAALVVRWEDNFAYDSDVGSQRGLLFLEMISNLGLRDMDDDNFDSKKVSIILDRFLKREYSPTGEGGLFICNHYDMRNMEIWNQLCTYISENEKEDI